ncbi:MAG: hypothetical protein M5R36_14900 [Deltaproteobacteria bacterium]|nr:hypothetical protein [Deltaproteobacteria bacterium]
MSAGFEDLTFDTGAGRDEGGSPELLAYVERHQPRTVHFGHIHQPRRREATVGKTRLVNIGCFRDEKRAYVLDVG